MTQLKWSALPILDLTRLDGDGAEKERFLTEIRQAVRELGFFYLTGHGVENDLTQGVVAASRRFFELPAPAKLEIEMVNSPHFRGYTRPGWERTAGQRDWREQIDIGAERPALPTNSGLPAWSRLQGPNQWPTTLPELRPILNHYQTVMSGVANRLLRAFAAALGQAETVFDPIFQPDPHELLKVIRYPGREDTESEQGVGSHKDSGCITVLLQDVQAGLQVKYEDDWIDVPPMPGTFVVNLGEMLEMASNGYLKATVHRVLTPPAGKDRLSVAFFLDASLSATVPLLDLPPALAADVPGVTRDPQNPLFYEIGKNHLKGRLRSHPDVARRHYADLLDPTSLATV